MNKFPVISKSGNEYEVEIFFGESIAYAGLNVIIREKTKGIFGRVKFKKLRHFSIFKSEREVLETFSYVELARKYVGKYEVENAADIAYKKRVEAIEREFEEWDGRC